MVTSEKKPLSVKQLNLYIKSLFEGDFHLADILVRGEISNFKSHYASGHLYFTLKDSDAAIRCVMFKNNAARLNFEPENDIEVVLRGRVSVYEKDGQYMLYVSEMHEAGVGDLAIKFAEIKKKLEKEGLFDEHNKRPLPKYPKKIAVITSDSGAALKDIQNILNMRYPFCDVIVCPALVQGLGASESLVSTLERVYRLQNVDLIIIGRGGGSAEDLSVFNDEALARKIFESPIPVISAVGHETDFTICDLVADKRASTPSHAAEIAVPDISEIIERINLQKSQIITLLNSSFENRSLRLSKYSDNLKGKTFERFLDIKSQRLDIAAEDVMGNFDELFLKKQQRFFTVVAKLDALSPYKILARGYTAVKRDDQPITLSGVLNIGDKLKLKFSDGSADCVVTGIESEK